MALGSQLAQIALKNSAASISTRIQASRKGKQQEDQIQELIEIVNDLIDERNQLISIARGYEEAVTAQRISEDDITYITDKLIPVIEELVGLADDGSADTKEQKEMRDAMTAMKSILSVEMLSIMQLIGFNYREAIGRPLTALVSRLILARSPMQEEVEAELRTLGARHDVELLRVVQDPEAWTRLNMMQGTS